LLVTLKRPRCREKHAHLTLLERIDEGSDHAIEVHRPPNARESKTQSPAGALIGVYEALNISKRAS
jgi:hypothetical protein